MRIIMDKLKNVMYCCIYMISLASGGWSQESKKPAESASEKLCHDKEEFSETHHQVMINGQPVAYQAIVGSFLLKDEKCQAKANLFYVSYTKEGVENQGNRPITFCFNGGPGSASLWLNIGVLGPKRVYLDDSGSSLVPPFHLVDNEFSLLDITDLVFIDPVSTGYSRAIPPEDAKKFHGVNEDVKSVAEFIRLYMTRFNRWDSPKFIIGESYGTTRAAALAGYLHDNYFVYINGITLLSNALNFQTLEFAAGNDFPYLLFLPSYTATAWYHKKLAPDLQANFQETLQAARNFVNDEYACALFKGDLLPSEEKQRLIQQLARFTGLSPEYIERNNLRIDMMHFAKELLRDQKRIVGRFDGRFKGIDSQTLGDYCADDPSAEAIFGAFTGAINHYIQTDLKWKTDTPYKILANVQPWNYGVDNQYLNVAEILREVMSKNPFLRVFVGNGYYDLATPFFATEYTFNHLGLDASILKHVTMKYYEAGHLMYTYRPALIKLKEDLASFYAQTLINQEREQKALSESMKNP